MKLIRVGEITQKIASHTGISSGIPIYMSRGLRAHIVKRHPDCLKYLSSVETIISAPDYIGKSPNEPNSSFEVVKVLDKNVQVAMRLEPEEEYYYIATLHTITDSKLERRIKSGRLKVI